MSLYNILLIVWRLEHYILCTLQLSYIYYFNRTLMHSNCSKIDLFSAVLHFLLKCLFTSPHHSISPTQVLKGINSTQASTVQFGRVFSKAISIALNVTLGSIQITSVAATSARRTLSLSEANLDIDINVDMVTEDERILGEIKTLILLKC